MTKLINAFSTFTETNAQGVEFEAANSDAVDYGDVSGSLSDGKLATISAWLFIPSWPGVEARVFSISILGPTRFAIYTDPATSGRIIFFARNSAATTVLDAGLTSFPLNQWVHLLVSIDQASGMQVYINGSDASANLTVSTLIDSNIDFSAGTGSRTWVGAFHLGSQYWNGYMADLYVNLSAALDISVEGNRRKFISADGKPVYLGANGQIPTGSQPQFFHTGPTATWHTNRGSVSGGTETGALSDAPSNPTY